MYSKNKAGFLKTFIAVTKRLFRARNIIIISDHKVDHVPLSGIMQILLIIGVVGFFSGVSYITGSYMTARTALREKDRRIVTTTLEKSRIGEEMDMLKRDLTQLSQNGKDLNAYSKFVIDQYTTNNPEHNNSLPFSAMQMSEDGPFSQPSTKLLERISYLEGRLQDIRSENDHLVVAIRDRTEKKIAYFEDIIAMTGLDTERLEHSAKAIDRSENASASVALPGRHVKTPIHHDASGDANVDPNDDEDIKKEQIHGENQGGPFIPYDSALLSENNRDLVANVERLVMLHDIVEQLPLDQPLEESQVTGPFGKRVDPLNGHFAIHPGIDLAGPANAQIMATSPGKVITAGRRIAYGNAVDIDHGFGIVTRYAHMSKVLVHDGEYVHKGQVIGIQGSTGRSTGPHLHYEVRINDHPVNPAKFLHAGEYVLEN